MVRVVLPERCVFARGGQRCRVFVDHYRDRKTGPGFPLAVVGCSRHPQGRFTLYPLGHVPYGRQAVVPCSPSGPLLQEQGTGQPPWSANPWQATLFGAALEAADGQRWPAHRPADDERRRRTQGCRLEQAGRLLGVHPELKGRTRERIATRVQVPTLSLRQASQRWTSSWQARGEAILSVLMALPVDGGLLDRVLAAGAVSGLWPWPQRWDPVRHTWVRARSRPPKRARVEAAPSRAPPPTNSPAVRGG